MTRRDFQLIADTIRRQRSGAPHFGPLTADQADEVAREFALSLKGTNPNFDPSRFLAACAPQTGRKVTHD